MTLPQTLSEYWQEMSDLTIYDAAIWMAIEADPLEHEFEWTNNNEYAIYFNDHPGGLQAVDKKCAILISAVRSGNIRVTPMQHSSGALITSKTYIPKQTWVDWCRQSGYVDLNNLFSQQITVNTPPVASAQPITAPIIITTSHTTTAITPPYITPISSTYTPFNAIGKLAVKAAIKIEQSTGKRAIVKEVMKQLQEWAEAGSEPDVLMRPDKSKRSVIWKTDKQAEKEYTTEACVKTLKNWNKSRQ